MTTELQTLRTENARLRRDLQGRIQACDDHGRNHMWQLDYIRGLERQLRELTEARKEK